MAYTFAVDTDQLDALANETLKDAKKKVMDNVKNIYDDIENINKDNDWSGDSYDTFKSGTDAYRGGLETLNELIEAFMNEINRLKDDPAKDCIENIKKAIELMKSE